MKEIKNRYGADLRIKDFDKQFFISNKGENKAYPWKGNPNEVSLHTYIRNQIHHQADNGKATLKDLETSINVMRNYL